MNGRDRYLSTTQGGYSHPTPAPVSTGTPNFGSPGQGGDNLPPQNNNTNNQGIPPGGAAGFTPSTPGPTEEEIKMARFKEAQADYNKYGDDLSLWMEDPDAFEAAADMGFFSAQNEGVLGGVSEYEKQTNLMKKAIASKVGKMNTQGLTDKQFESGLTSLPEYESLLKLYGGDADAMHATLFAPGTFEVTDKGFVGTFDPNVDTGYDPTGINTWQDTEGDPEKLDAYHLLNDPNANPWSDEYFDALEKIGYSFPSFDQNWYGGDWDEFLGEPYGGYPESASLSDPKYWAQKSLGELNPTGFANLEQMYGEELANKMAAPHAWGIEPFSEMIIEGDY